MKVKSWMIAPWLALALVACGGSVPSGNSLTGTWNDTVKNNYGIVRMQYRLVQQGDQLSGEVFASKQNQLLRVGTVSGTLGPSGSAEINGVFDENGASGSSRLEGSFSGNSFSGTLRTYKSDGNPNQTLSQNLVRVSASAASASAPEPSADLSMR